MRLRIAARPLLALLAAAAAAGASAVPAAAQSPAGGRLFIAVRHVHGRPPFAFVGLPIAVHGTVVPYVAGQKVRVSFYGGRRRLATRTVSVLEAERGVGRFRVSYTAGGPGTVTVRVAHRATTGQRAFGARPSSVRIIDASLAPGAGGEAVRVLQSYLARLHYAVPQSGYFDDATGRAVIAFRKMVGQALVPSTDRQMFLALGRGAGAYRVRFPHDGRHVEADLTRQVLVEIDRGGRVHQIYTMSSGKPSTPTVIGHFHVYLKDPGTNSEGMVDSNYFISGYAIHGYADVPTYAASHGCLRIPIPDAPAVFSWVKLGDAVDVYEEGGGGSHTVRGNAGP